MSSKLSPRRKSPEKKTANQDLVLPSAKRNFLTSVENTCIKSPIKRHVTPLPCTPEKVIKEPVIEDLSCLSPATLKKIGLGSPPQKVKVSWKSRWQSTLNGDGGGGRKKRKQDEASKLLDDEGVIQMLNRVPSVYGLIPKLDSNSGSRAQRARANPTKQKEKVPMKVSKKKVDSTVGRKVNKEDLKQVIQLDTIIGDPSENRTNPNLTTMPLAENGITSPMKMESGLSAGAGFLSPKRSARREGNYELEENLSLIRRSDDCFVHLTELPSEQLELLMNCDIRFSLPKQGAPAVPSKDTKIPSNQPIGTTDKPKEGNTSSLTPKQPTITADKPKPPPITVNGISGGTPLYKLPPLPTPDQPAEVEDKLQELLQHCQGQTDESKQPSNLIQGQYSQIFVRFFENFVQITMASGRTKLKGSLNPSMIDEVTHALQHAAESKRVRGVLVTGVGGVFCQGVDLTFLSSESQVERRRNNASQMAAAVERLVLALVSFPKLLVAAVNGTATGLGMTMLPLFDVVYANDKATFNTFYSRLGQIPEGAASATLGTTRGGPLNDMLLMGRALTADQMREQGIVSQVFFPGRLMEEAIPRMKKACAECNTGLQWNKLLLKQYQKNQVEQVVSGETELLKEIWSSKEYHVNLVKFLNSEKCLQFQKPTS